MRLILLLLAVLALALPVQAQTVSDAGLHPGVYSFLPRAPWLQDQTMFTITHTAAAAKVDTFLLTGIRTTAQVLLQRRATPLISVASARIPTISIVSDTLFVSWPTADTLTYDVYATKRKRF